MNKECTVCHMVKPMEDYHKHTGFKDGHKAHCKDCAKQKKASYYNATTRICDKCSAEKTLQDFNKNKNSPLGHKTTCKICSQNEWKRWYSENKKPVLSKAKTYSQTPEGRFIAYKSSANQRKIDFDLSFESFILLWQAPCFYCGNEISTIGIDRIDSSKGYHDDNIISCCIICNKMKLTLSHELFINHIKQIIKHQGEDLC